MAFSYNIDLVSDLGRGNVAQHWSVGEAQEVVQCWFVAEVQKVVKRGLVYDLQ